MKVTKEERREALDAYLDMWQAIENGKLNYPKELLEKEKNAFHKYTKMYPYINSKAAYMVFIPLLAFMVSTFFIPDGIIKDIANIIWIIGGAFVLFLVLFIKQNHELAIAYYDKWIRFKHSKD